ncbi:MAG: hypothetical protein IIB33_06760, partial [Chloroflexi bacterium]|nr:hypothetical protein [Chloroflexota bacterium]
MSLLRRVEEVIRAGGWLQPSGCALVVAVSGGPDSMTLLGLLHTLAQKYPLRLHGAHLNHGLRGAEGDEDARYVQETCRRWGIPLTIERADVAGLRAQYRPPWAAAAREACAGATVVFQCASAPYMDWTDPSGPKPLRWTNEADHLPAITEGAISAAATAGARLVYGDNHYMYGPVDGPL